MITVGEHTYGVENMYIDCDKHGPNLTIGKYCSIARNITVLLFANHRTDTITTYPFNTLKGIGEPNSCSKGDINIGNDVWIGINSTILSGVTIGDGAVIGAGAVVSKNVPPYAIAVGNPARVVKYRFSEGKIKQLLEAKWWDWSDEKIKENIRWLTS